MFNNVVQVYTRTRPFSTQPASRDHAGPDDTVTQCRRRNKKRYKKTNSTYKLYIPVERSIHAPSSITPFPLQFRHSHHTFSPRTHGTRPQTGPPRRTSPADPPAQQPWSATQRQTAPRPYPRQRHYIVTRSWYVVSTCSFESFQCGHAEPEIREGTPPRDARNASPRSVSCLPLGTGERAGTSLGARARDWNGSGRGRARRRGS